MGYVRVLVRVHVRVVYEVLVDVYSTVKLSPTVAVDCHMARLVLGLFHNSLLYCTRSPSPMYVYSIYYLRRYESTFEGM